MLSRSSRWASLLFVVFHFSHSRWRSAAEWTPTTAVPFVDMARHRGDRSRYDPNLGWAVRLLNRPPKPILRVRINFLDGLKRPCACSKMCTLVT